MDREGSVEVTIVNRYYPPSKVIIAESAANLAQYLTEHGVHVKIVQTTAEYDGVGAEVQPVGEIFKVKSIYEGKNMLLRFFSAFIESYRLIKKALKVSNGYIIVMTSPGFLSFWAARLFRVRKTKWIYWTMDLFPESFVGGGLIKPSNPVYKYFHKVTYAYPPNYLLALGQIQADYLYSQYKLKPQTILLPCGVLLNKELPQETPSEIPEWKKEPNKIYFGYAGNLGAAHSSEFLRMAIDNIDPETQHLVLVVYGAKAQLIKDYLITPKPGVTLLEYIPREELSHIDVHLVSLVKESVNICVPSKLVSGVHQGALFLFYGIKECDSWDYLQEAGWRINPGPDEENEIQSFFQSSSRQQLNEKRTQAAHMPDLLYQNTVDAYQKLLEVIVN